MNKSDSIAKLAAAMVKAQTQVGIAIKNAVNPHLKNRYADLGAVWDAIAPAMKEYGLAAVQMPAPSDDGRLHLETMLLHESGEWMSSIMVMPLAKQDPQGYGAALTYARRYALAALMGVTQDDDDGDRAVTRRAETESAPATETQLTALLNVLRQYGRTWEQLSDAILSGAYKGLDMATLTVGDAATCIKFVEGRLHDAKNKQPATA